MLAMEALCRRRRGAASDSSSRRGDKLPEVPRLCLTRQLCLLSSEANVVCSASITTKGMTETERYMPTLVVSTPALSFPILLPSPFDQSGDRAGLLGLIGRRA